MGYQLLTAPAAEPIGLVEAKLHLQVDSDLTADDPLITALVTAVRQYAEQLTASSLVAQQWRLVQDSFPGPSLMGVPYGVPYSLPGHAILLEKGPVQSVDSITYTAMDGTTATMPATDYVADLSDLLTRITPRFGKIWPIPLPQIGAVQVNFTAGYGGPFTADAVANTITLPTWKTLAIGDKVRLSNTGGALPAGLQPNVDYYVVAVPSAGVYQLSATAGGAAIDITDAGTGTSLVGVVPEGLKNWMKLRIKALYDNREELVTGRGVQVTPLPFIDSLLDPYSIRRV